tara:strand:- start:284 stop:433 length:150 start_codon:yes stop_codon:yes gene_type:complete
MEGAGRGGTTVADKAEGLQSLGGPEGPWAEPLIHRIGAATIATELALNL